MVCEPLPLALMLRAATGVYPCLEHLPESSLLGIIHPPLPRRAKFLHF
jgi:hypothetical protein